MWRGGQCFVRDVSNLGLNVYGQNIEVITCNCISFCLFMGRSFHQVFFSSVHFVFFLSNCRSVRVKINQSVFQSSFWTRLFILSFARSVDPFVLLSTDQSVWLSAVNQSVNKLVIQSRLFVCQSGSRSFNPFELFHFVGCSVCLSIRPSVHRLVTQSVSLTVFLSFCMSVCLSD